MKYGGCLNDLGVVLNKQALKSYYVAYAKIVLVVMSIPKRFCERLGTIRCS